MEYGRVTDRELGSIKKMVGSERISVGESILDLHAKDKSFHQRRKPDVVVWPLNAEEIGEILKLANEKRIPVTPWGAWYWAWKKEVYGKRAWGKSRIDEADQKAFRPQWNHESWENI